jgi:hypothetical protein
MIVVNFYMPTFSISRHTQTYAKECVRQVGQLILQAALGRQGVASFSCRGVHFDLIVQSEGNNSAYYAVFLYVPHYFRYIHLPCFPCSLYIFRVIIIHKQC